MIRVGKRRIKLSHIDLLAKAKSVRTFDKQDYDLMGTLAVNKHNGAIFDIADIYYHVRTARNDYHDIIAKRKHPSDELCRYKNND